jgi:ADP-ribose pyrophosphatase YjhB (NUDIX family)
MKLFNFETNPDKTSKDKFNYLSSEYDSELYSNSHNSSRSNSRSNSPTNSQRFFGSNSGSDLINDLNGVDRSGHKFIQKGNNGKKKKRKKIKRRSKLILFGYDYQKKNQTITLFKSRHWKVHVLPGGKVEKGADFEKTLVREILEESFNTLDLSKLNLMNFVDNVTDKEHVRLYKVNFNLDDYKNVYARNKKCILTTDEKRIPREWLEMEDFSTFNLTELTNLMEISKRRKQDRYLLHDVHGKANFIYHKTLDNLGHYFEKTNSKTNDRKEPKMDSNKLCSCREENYMMTSEKFSFLDNTTKLIVNC